jgi:hypothetical protein
MIEVIEKNTKVFCIGDLHGCYEELIELFSKLPINLNKDKVCWVGDYLDRGPKQVECLRFVKNAVETGYGIAVLGNHDSRYARYAKHVETKKNNPFYKIPLELSEERKKIFDCLDDSDRAFLVSLPSYVILQVNGKDWLLVHAGVMPKKPLIEHDIGYLTHIRYIDPTTNKSKGLVDFKQPENTVFWTNLYDHPYNVVYGHHAHSRENVRIDIVDDKKLVGIDTACCFGGKLSCYELTTGSVFQVKSKKVYFELIE